MSNIFLKRVYEPYDDTDGCRILIDRLWPRGISKEAARLSYWFKEIAPSNELRKWFCHKPELFEEFHKQYINELCSDEQKQQMIEQIIDLSTKDRVTLLYGAKDPVYNHGVVLYEELKRIVNH
ncbi:DUF488 domain-containing protein [Bacillus sp. 1P10SD]|uniref:DUF488 domain-containing protein n=1 Tax=Bacillus sp. 1P10SD TaxID=3132265 RepID=UPI0039A410C8